MTNIAIECACGELKGDLRLDSPDIGNRIVCYCDDCQNFAHYLERGELGASRQSGESGDAGESGERVLDEHGGTDIYQLPPSLISFTQGQEQVRCVRLTEKGLHRWYTACCNTPIGNTGGAGMPFLGLIHGAMCPELDDSQIKDSVFGQVRGYVHKKYAIGELPEDKLKKPGLPLLLRSLFKLLVWKIKGLNKQSPFFDSDGFPMTEPIEAIPMSKS